MTALGTNAGVRRAAVLALAAALLAAACARQTTATPPTVQVYKSRGGVQCGDAGVTPEAMAQTLTAAGITALGSRCVHDGFMRAAVCGAGNGEVNVYEIAATDVAAAKRLGFRELSTLPQARPVPCRR